jgi:hypothetical protein
MDPFVLTPEVALLSVCVTCRGSTNAELCYSIEPFRLRRARRTRGIISTCSRTRLRIGSPDEAHELVVAFDPACELKLRAIVRAQ